MNNVILTCEDPPSSTALLANSPSFLALSILSLLSSPSSKTFSKAFLIVSLFTLTPTSSSSPHISGSSDPSVIAMFKTCATSFSLRNWSANSGHVTMGTPAHTPSRVEFHPQ
ncbi:hypothetical protein PanWU01x14_367100 [Parasponia andersonii]|uniref:Uncharacterized protein n=1 Tax=Parasponia andersonii TaxID=3476 RepID=A0A2P5A5D8_PARAD|nr:hypothetical protein PanWU01x14_367100 [Parasponia andersonii]